MKKILLLSVLLAFIFLNVGAQQVVKISTPDSTVITYSSADSRAFALTGLITYYANNNWPGSSSDSGCIYWGVNDTLFNVINADNTTSNCTGMSNLLFYNNPAYTNLANGQACFIGTTRIWDAMYGTYFNFNAYQYIYARKKSNGAVIPFDLVKGMLLAKVPDADFYIYTNLMLVYQYAGNYYYPGVDAYGYFYMGLSYSHYAIDIFNRMHTDFNRKICTSWDGGDFYRIPFDAGFELNQPACYGTATGIINTTASGGVAPLLYSWNTSNPNSEDQLGIKAGNYSVNISDAAHCILTRDVSLNQPDSLRANLALTQVSCAGKDDGSALVAPSGGTGVPDINWYNASSGTTVTGLAPGKYWVEIKDEAACKTKDTALITEPALLEYTLTSANPSCYGGSNGSILVSGTGGTAPYKYVWSSGDTVNLLEDLAGGSYSLTLSDANACSREIMADLVAPDQLAAVADITNVSCNGNMDGAIKLTISGGTSAYLVNWTNGSSGPDIAGLAAGDYTAAITDAHACTIEKKYSISQPEVLTLQLEKTDITCFGDANGTITATVSGGTLPYTYAWSNGANLSALTGLGVGDYELSLSDKNNCTLVNAKTISEPSQLELQLSLSSPVCSYGTDGGIESEVAGGTAPYTYLWSTGGTDTFLDRIPVGEYSLSLTDANDCVQTADASLVSLSKLMVEKAITPVSCFGLENGAASLAISGGLEPYDILWTGGNTSTERTGLGAGNYPFRVYDDYLCTVRDTAIVKEPFELLATATGTAPSCYQGSDGLINLSVSGGTEPFTFLWNTNAETPAISGLTAGTYTVEVKDAHECTTQASAELTDPAADFASFSVATDNGEATFTNSSTAGTYEWSFGDDLGSMDANPVHVYTSNGTYSVCLTLTSPCSTIQSCQDVVIDGITIIKKSASGIRIYPNPVRDIVNLSWKGSEIPVQFFIYDAVGRMVLNRNISSGETLNVDVSSLSQGIYQVKFMYDGYYKTVPMIINR